MNGMMHVFVHPVDGYKVIYDREVQVEVRVQEGQTGPQQYGTLEVSSSSSSICSSICSSSISSNRSSICSSSIGSRAQPSQLAASTWKERIAVLIMWWW